MTEERTRKRFTKAERGHIYAKTLGRCAYCGRVITLKEMQVDHVVAFEMWGRDDDDNLLPACRGCNNYKHTLTVEKFRQAAERWNEVLMRDNVTYRNAVRFGQVTPSPKPVVFYFEKIGIKVPTWDDMVQREIDRRKEAHHD
jgi:hypothetical protein